MRFTRDFLIELSRAKDLVQGREAGFMDAYHQSIPRYSLIARSPILVNCQVHDTLSLFLFTLVADILSGMMTSAIERNTVRELVVEIEWRDHTYNLLITQSCL